MSFMLSIVNADSHSRWLSFMLSVIYTQCRVFFIFMLSVIMLSVVMLSDVASFLVDA
jgi:hypothetical protein